MGKDDKQLTHLSTLSIKHKTSQCPKFNSVTATLPLPLTSALPTWVFPDPSSETFYTRSALPYSHFIFSFIVFAKYLNHLMFSLKTKSSSLICWLKNAPSISYHSEEFGKVIFKSKETYKIYHNLMSSY